MNWRVLAVLAGAIATLASGLPVQDASAEANAKPRRTLCAHNVAEGQTLRVHGRPDAAGPVVAELAADACDIRMIGTCRGRWCKMVRGNATGWIDTRHVGIYEYPSAANATARPLPPGRAIAAPSTDVVEPAPATKTAPNRAELPPKRPEATPARADAPPSQRASSAVSPPPPAQRGSRRPVAVAPPVDEACVVGVARWDTLRLRRGPGVAHDAIGGIPANACEVRQVGGCRGTWCQVAWHGRTGWVNTQYLD